MTESVAFDVLQARGKMIADLGSNSERVVIPQQAIDQIFLRANHQQEYMVELYKLVIPNWYKTRTVGYPVVSKETYDYIARLAAEFDRKHHADVQPGGAWFNAGFSRLGGYGLPEWIAVIPNDLTYLTEDEALEKWEKG